MKKSINKKELATYLKEQNPDVPANKIEEALEVFFSEISTALVCGDRIELRGFGSMVVRKRKSKVARNPKTNQKIEVGNKGSLYFRASKELIKQLNGSVKNDL